MRWRAWQVRYSPAAAQGVGSIGGLINDNSGAMLPGVTVTLSNPRGTIGGNQATVTDERGAFQFLRLVPGTYTVRAELPGFRPALQENIVVDRGPDGARRSEARNRRAESKRSRCPASRRCSTRRRRPRQTVLSREVLDSLPNRVGRVGAARVIPERDPQQGRRRRIGIVPAVERRPSTAAPTRTDS